MNRVWALVPSSQPWPEGVISPAVGGVPDPVGRLVWPACSVCGQPMRFLFQLPHLAGRLELAPDAAIYAFQCDEHAWDGANAVLGFPKGAPRELEGLRHERPLPRTLLALEEAQEDAAALSIDVNEADDDALSTLDRAQAAAPPSKIGGVPVWVQGYDDVECCGRPMTFLAQVDSEPFGLDFGDAGRAYLFRCDVPGCDAGYRLLVQSA